MTQKRGLILKRSVLLAGHRTSVTLEEPFWRALQEAAVRRGVSMNALIAQVDAQREGNLASALRIFVLREAQKERA